MRAIAASVLLASSLAAQRTWIVDSAGGPGVHFTDIPPAIAAASPRDRIVVRGAGPYSGFTVSAGLDIEAGGARVPRIVVHGVPAGQSAWVSGFVAGDMYLATPNVLQVSNCQGSVTLNGINVGTIGLLPLPSQGVLISGSASVVITACRFAPPNLNQSPFSPLSTMEIDHANVTMSRSTVNGMDGSWAQFWVYPGGPAIVCGTASRLVADGVQITGGTGGSSTHGVCAQAGGDALVNWGGAGIALNGSVLTGGPGGAGSSACPAPGPSGYAVIGPVRVTQDCTLTGPVGGITRVPPLPALSGPAQLALGQPVTFTARAAAGSLMLTLFDDDHSQVPVPGLEVPLLLRSFFTGPVLLIGAGGTAPWTITLPNDPAWRDRYLFLQGLSIDPAAPSIQLTGLADARLR